MDYQNLVAKALSDDAFAEALCRAPGETLASLGVTATPEMLEALKGVDVASLRQLAGSFGDNKAALP